MCVVSVSVFPKYSKWSWYSVYSSCFLILMPSALEKGDRVEIRGLCSFHVKDYEGYTGRNPKTGETVEIAPKKLPFFKCGKGLRERVDR